MSGFKGFRRIMRLAGRDATRVREDFDDEVRFHLDMRIAELIAAGASRDASGSDADASRRVSAQRGPLSRVAARLYSSDFPFGMLSVRHSSWAKMRASTTI